MEEYHRRLEEAERQLRAFDTMLRGDGNGIKGFMARLSQVEAYMFSLKDTISKIGWKIFTAFLTVIGMLAVDIWIHTKH